MHRGGTIHWPLWPSLDGEGWQRTPVRAHWAARLRQAQSWHGITGPGASGCGHLCWQGGSVDRPSWPTVQRGSRSPHLPAMALVLPWAQQEPQYWGMCWFLVALA